MLPACPNQGLPVKKKRKIKSYSIIQDDEPVKTEIADSDRFIFTIRRLLKKEQIESDQSHVLLLTISNGESSWGSQSWLWNRGFKGYLKMISQFEYPKRFMSYAFLTSDIREYHVMKKELDRFFDGNEGIPLVKLMYDDSIKFTVARENRQDPSLQKERRRLLARYRNTLTLSSLEQFHDAVLWIDADIVRIPNDLLAKFVKSDKEIIVPRTNYKSGREYDMNTWAGPRLKPTIDQRNKVARGEFFEPNRTPDTKFLHMFPSDSEEFVEMDSVGGTVLFMRAEVVRQGVVFTTQYIVGAEWEYEGYDGIETEGICLLAQRLCFKCWGMPKEVCTHD